MDKWLLGGQEQPQGNLAPPRMVRSRLSQGLGLGGLVSSALGAPVNCKKCSSHSGLLIKIPFPTSHGKARLQNNSQRSLPELLIHIKLMGSDTFAERFPRSKGNCSSK